MNPNSIKPSRRLFLLCLVPFALLVGAAKTEAQNPYRNIVNQKFRTVSNGVQSANILDVRDAKNTDEVRKLVLARLSAKADAERSSLTREIEFLRRTKRIKPNQQLDLSEVVITRQNGKLQVPDNGERHRAPDSQLTFTVATTGDGAFTVPAAAEIQGLIDLIYPYLRDNVYGRPGWSGNIIVRNLDPNLGKVSEVLGSTLVINGNNVEIYFPTFRAYETRFLAMAQVIAQAFHAKQRIAYDAYEYGMSRAAAVATAQGLRNQLPNGNTVDPSNGFYYTPAYDLLNQPALANNTFTPPTKTNQPFIAANLSGMLIPRLQMSSTAWLKCYIENPNFFKLFNTGSADGLGTAGYYGAFTSNANTANDVTQLRNLAKAAVPTVELDPFDRWYEKQYVLDTSVTPGPKIYVYAQPTFPGTDTNALAAGAALFGIYYRTTLTADGKGDETDLSGLSQVVYWDNTFTNRLFLPSYEELNVTNGFGSVSPVFDSVDTQRIAIDVPLNNEYQRIYFPAKQTDTTTGTTSVVNDFSGVVIGANDGNVRVSFEGGTGDITAPILRGSFGAPGTSLPTAFSRTQIVYTPSSGGPLTFQRNVFVRPDNLTTGVFGVSSLFVLSVPAPVVSLSHTFPAGASMISLPVRPLPQDLAQSLGLNPTTTLLAQYRQDLQTPDKYQRYPQLPSYQPGYSLWGSFAGPLAAANIRGTRTDSEQYVTISTLFGWNQIATPYEQSLNVNTDLQFQYLGGDVVLLNEAISRGWVAAGVIGYTPRTGYQDITGNGLDPVFPANTLEAWKGYWLRVLVTEGLNVSYANPNPVTRAAKSRLTNPTKAAVPPIEANSWRLALTLSDESGQNSVATLGQSLKGSETFTPSLHVAEPPALTRGANLRVRFPHPDWDGGGDFLTDIRKTGTRSVWNIVADTPASDITYTLKWGGLSTLPRGNRLTITDLDSNLSQVMKNSSGMTFRSSRTATTRRFQIVSEPRNASRLRITNINANVPNLPGRAVSSVTIGFELNAVAETSVVIRSNGRIIRRLGGGRAATTGINQMVWDVRDERGVSVPSGTYLIEVTARSSEGDQTRRVTPLVLTR